MVDALHEDEEGTHLDVLAWGYLAVMHRLHVRELPVPPVEGMAGSLAIPTLMADAPLVALALSKAGHTVTAALSHPGSNPEAMAAMHLMHKHLQGCQFGPNCGTPFHLQVLLKSGKHIWLSDPTRGLESLLTANSQSVARWVYVDAYAWLGALFEESIPRPSFQDGIFVNIGALPSNELKSAATKWRRFAGTGQLIVQASAGDLTLPDTEIIRLSRLIASSGTDFAVLTAGDAGLAVTSSKGTSYARSERIDCVKLGTDPCGAGAAVSASVLHTLLTGVRSEECLATRAAEAGRVQCMVSGSLGKNLLRDWVAALQFVSGRGSLYGDHAEA